MQPAATQPAATQPAATQPQGVKFEFKTGSLAQAIKSITEIVGIKNKLLARAASELTQDSNNNGGQVNAAMLAQLNLDMSGNSMLSEEAKKMADKQEQASQAWVR